MAMSAAQNRDIEIGLTVMTSDGRRVGNVKEIKGSYFKVDAPMHRDFWLNVSLIETCGAKAVLLFVSSESIADHQLGQAGLEPAEDPMAAIAAAPVISQQEQLEQRGQMERELAEQSRHLSPQELPVTQIRGARAWERIPADHKGFGKLAGEYVPNAPVQDHIEQDQGRKQFRRRLQRTALAGAAVAVSVAVVFAGALFLRKRRQSRAVHRSAAALRARASAMTEGARTLTQGAS